MNILAIETSTHRGSVGAWSENGVVFDQSFPCERGHSSDLFANLEMALRELGRCDRIVVGLGPGSYSGVRIAIAAAIGIGFGTGAELVGIPSMLAMDTELPRYRVIGDARRNSFYFAEVKGRALVEGPLLFSPEDLAVRLNAEPCVVLASAPIQQFPDAQMAFPIARELARLAQENIGISARQDLEPIYLREPHITPPKRRPV